MEAIGRCALLVEDEFLVALETEAILRDLGCRDVYSVAGVKAAIESIDESPPDFAIVDVNLGGEQSWPVMQALVLRDIPFAVATGYAMPDQLLHPYGSPPVLRKPITAPMLRSAVLKLKAEDAGSQSQRGDADDQKSRSA